jgi:hypothetical protein
MEGLWLFVSLNVLALLVSVFLINIPRRMRIRMDHHMKHDQTPFERKQNRIAVLWFAVILLIICIGGMGFGLLVLR